jgi:hypothetical protein
MAASTASRCTEKTRSRLLPLTTHLFSRLSTMNWTSVFIVACFLIIRVRKCESVKRVPAETSTSICSFRGLELSSYPRPTDMFARPLSPRHARASAGCSWERRACWRSAHFERCCGPALHMQRDGGVYLPRRLLRLASRVRRWQPHPDRSSWPPHMPAPTLSAKRRLIRCIVPGLTPKRLAMPRTIGAR